MKNITVHYRPIDYDQQFAAIDQVCCRKASFFKMSLCPTCSRPIRQL